MQTPEPTPDGNLRDKGWQRTRERTYLLLLSQHLRRVVQELV